MNPYADWTIEISWEVFGAVFILGMLFTKRTVRSQPEIDRLIQLVLLILGFCLIAGLWFRSGFLGEQFLPGTKALQFAGAAMTAAGCLFGIWARLTLGGNWSGRPTVKADHELIVKGPYGLARHPIYTGILAASIGTGLAIREWRCILGFAVVLFAILIKMRQEERLMMETFPEDYPCYRQRVKALIPGLL